MKLIMSMAEVGKYFELNTTHIRSGETLSSFNYPGVSMFIGSFEIATQSDGQTLVMTDVEKFNTCKILALMSALMENEHEFKVTNSPVLKL